MTTWNHRVLLTEHDLFGPTYDIIEVFYNHDGSVRGYTAADVQSYESPEELRGTIEAMLTAFDHPALTRAQLDAINRPGVEETVRRQAAAMDPALKDAVLRSGTAEMLANREGMTP